jgi:hypothetical protein
VIFAGFPASSAAEKARDVLRFNGDNFRLWSQGFRG